MKKAVLICLAGLLCGAAVSAQDIIHLKDGRKIAGKVATQSKDLDRIFYETYEGTDTLTTFLPLGKIEYIDHNGQNMIYNSLGILTPLNTTESPKIPQHRSVMVRLLGGSAFGSESKGSYLSVDAVHYIKNVFGVGIMGQILWGNLVKDGKQEKVYLVAPQLEYRIPMRVQHFFHIGIAPGLCINPTHTKVEDGRTRAYIVEFGARIQAGFDIRLTRGFYLDCGFSCMPLGTQTILFGVYGGFRFGPEKKR